MAVFDALNYNNEVFRAYITWSGILIVKMMMMGFLTGFQRFRKGVSKTEKMVNNVVFIDEILLILGL